MPILISCPQCACAVKPAEVICPHCDGLLRNADGSITRTAIAVILGLSGIALPGCTESAPKYGAPATDNNATATATATASTIPSATQMPSHAEPVIGPAYGVSETPSTKLKTPPPLGPEPPRGAPEYGVPRTR